MKLRALQMAILICFVVSTTLPGCAPSPPKDRNVNGTFVAAMDVNPDPEGRPSPVVLRIYQLQSVVKFNNADFFGLYDDAGAVLGADLVAFDEITLRPGQSVDYQAQFKPTVKFVGIVAAFRDINSAQWRSDLAFPKKQDRLRITLEKLAVSASFDD